MPLPPFGTLGAVIMMRSPMPNRRAIFDIGIAGPLMGLLLSLPAIVIGLHLSKCMDAVELLRYYVAGNKWVFMLGTPQLFDWIENLVVGGIPPGVCLDYHPLAYAGWVGLFVTALNLIPVGQLDGGHILYALFGRRSLAISRGVVVGALLLAVGIWVSLHSVWVYTPFIVLVFLFTYRFPHPPPLDEVAPIGCGRKMAGAIALVLFVLCFTPQPVSPVDAEKDLERLLEQQPEEEHDWTPQDLLRWTRKV
jgi:membrane-associated protease RseP (regulator of RpoE activity)